MYQRRLLLLVAAMAAATLVPAAWMVRLTVVRGAEFRAEAEKRLVNRQWLPTVRGQITDRKGRVLAIDRPTFDIAVDYAVITGQRVDSMAARTARAASPGEWKGLGPEGRDALVRARRAEYDAHLEAMWDQIARIAGIGREDIDERRAAIRAEVQLLATTVTEEQRRERERELLRDSEVLIDDDNGGAEGAGGRVSTRDVQRPIREQVEAHVVLRDVPDSVGFELARLQAQTGPDPSRPGKAISLMPGLRVLDAKRRDYPFDVMEVPVDVGLLPGPLRREEPGTTRTFRVEGVATHVLGWMRSRLFKEDIERRPLHRGDGSIDLGHYRPGDPVGQGGFEQAAEDSLRGTRGVRTTHLDTAEIETTEPVRGTDVHLTIDVQLQARVQALFAPDLGLTVVQPWHIPKSRPEEAPGTARVKELPIGTALNGAIVVLDVASGDVLAMVSVPSFSHALVAPSAATGAGARAGSIFTDAYNLIYLNRTIDKPYPPGSIVKPLILASAVTTGKYDGSEALACTGHFFPDKPLLYRCWIYKQNHTTHTDQLGHDVNGSDAVKVSCNIFFFEMGRRLGSQGMHDLFTRFGVGADDERWNLFGLAGVPDRAENPLIAEHPGSVPRPGRATPSEAILMGIGQGPILWTPLHAADAYATLARGGVKLTPRLRADAVQKRTELGLDPRGVAQALDGLRRCANEDLGTTHTILFELPDGTKSRENLFTAPGVDVWAKSGTADAPPFVADLDSTGEHDAFDGDHAWCVLLAGDGGVPKYAVAVVIDYGGSGGKVGGPVANQVIHALVAEGYLPGGSGATKEAGREAAQSGATGFCQRAVFAESAP